MPKSNPTLCGSIAGKIGGLGVLMHNRAYQKAGINAAYVSFEPAGAREAVEAMRNLGIRGMGVTMPYKTEVMEYLDRIDETAAQIGAVNTIVNDNGVLVGYNTDYKGAVDGLLEVTGLQGKKVAMFGAGGVARAILYGLLKEGARVTVFNIIPEQGRELCAAMGAQFGGLPSDYDKEAGWDVLVNATSVGFQSDDTLLTADQFPQGIVVLDVVFNPIHTVFAAEAGKAGCRVVPGTRMLILQAIAQDELYLGIRPPFEEMEAALVEKFGAI